MASDKVSLLDARRRIAQELRESPYRTSGELFLGIAFVPLFYLLLPAAILLSFLGEATANFYEYYKSDDERETSEIIAASFKISAAVVLLGILVYVAVRITTVERVSGIKLV
tara:strand:+ start:10614 stop:10949 length:336 start_codon:yes stop_codon:yes gene_type:complete